MDQPDLFSQAKPQGTVHLFPLHRRADLVRKVAKALSQRSYKTGQIYWSLHVKRQRADLACQGLDPQSIEIVIARYAVEISRNLHPQEQFQRTPDDAA